MTEPFDEEKFVAEQTAKLYKMKCFDTMLGENGLPIVTRVPGGWIWCVASGGARIEMEEGQAIVGNQTVSTCFVPLDAEFDVTVHRKAFPH